MTEAITPLGLSDASTAWVAELVAAYECGPHDLRLLELAARSHDRAQQCREAVERDGVAITDRFGQVKPHPLLAEERQQGDLMRRAIATLAFTVDVPEGR